ncbi:MAG: hypothetical protein H0W20_11465 [Chthoniobacterales bacterium]|nr:hypothetical protein [Chthoniobacterales bacterium]
MWKLRLVAAAILVMATALPGRAQTGAFDAEGLERLERAMQMLQQRNAELEREVSQLGFGVRAST